MSEDPRKWVGSGLTGSITLKQFGCLQRPG